MMHENAPPALVALAGFSFATYKIVKRDPRRRSS